MIKINASRNFLFQYSKTNTNMQKNNSNPLNITFKGTPDCGESVERIFPGATIKGDIETKKPLNLGINSDIKGNVRSNGFIKLSHGSKIFGNASAGEFVVLSDGSKLFGDLTFPKGCSKISIDGKPVNIVSLGTGTKIGNICFEDGKGLVLANSDKIEHVNVNKKYNPLEPREGIEKIKITNGKLIKDPKKIDKINQVLKDILQNKGLILYR